MPTRRQRLGTDPLSWIVENGDTQLRPAAEKAHAKREHLESPKLPDVLSVNDRPLSPLLADYFLCRRCGTVGRGGDPSGNECPGCEGSAADAGFYFKKPVHTVIDLMQDTYQSTSLTARGPTADIPQLDLQQSLTILLLFCQLFEIAQEHVLRHIMTASRIPGHIANRLLADNRDPRRRAVKIFPTVTGETWRKAIDELTVERCVDYVDVVRFLKKTVDARDTLAVASDLSVFDDEMGKACMLRIDPLLDLHAALHNRYVPMLLWRDSPPAQGA